MPPAAGAALPDDPTVRPDLSGFDNSLPGDGADPGSDNDQALEPGSGDGSAPAGASGDVDSDADSREIADARAQGWVPESEWRGDKARWIDAHTFLDRAATVFPIVNARLRTENKALKDDIADLRARLDAQEATGRSFEEFQAEQRQGRAAVQRETLIADRRQALEDNDLDRVNEIDVKLLEMRGVAEVRKPAPRIDPGVQRAFTEFADANPWAKTEKHQRGLALAMRDVLSISPELRGRELLSEAADRYRSLNPALTRTAARRAVGDVDGTPGALSTPAGAARAYTSLKPDYKAQCDAFVRNGDCTKEQFLAECGPEAFRS